MDYLKLQVAFTTSMSWRLASTSARGTAVSLLMFAARTGWAGRIPRCLGWSEHQWRAAADVTGEHVLEVVEQGLAEWEGDDLVLAGFDHTGFKTLQTQRMQGHHGEKGASFGVKGGRPKTPQGGVDISPPVQPSPAQSSPVQSTQPMRASAPDAEDLFAEVASKGGLHVTASKAPEKTVGDLVAVGACIGREDRPDWDAALRARGFDALAAGIAAVRSRGAKAWLTAVIEAVDRITPSSAREPEYRIIDGIKVPIVN